VKHCLWSKKTTGPKQDKVSREGTTLVKIYIMYYSLMVANYSYVNSWSTPKIKHDYLQLTLRELSSYKTGNLRLWTTMWRVPHSRNDKDIFCIYWKKDRQTKVVLTLILPSLIYVYFVLILLNLVSSWICTGS
jgi:hypothetical protein